MRWTRAALLTRALTSRKRTLDGAEIDKIISDVQARKALAVERGRRKRWQRVIENAAAFNHS
jgi:hypothetical protein